MRLAVDGALWPDKCEGLGYGTSGVGALWSVGIPPASYWIPISASMDEFNQKSHLSDEHVHCIRGRWRGAVQCGHARPGGALVLVLELM